MNKAEIKRILKTARESKGKTQTEMAEILSVAMSKPYTLRQYQRYEEGLLPKYKREVVKELDNLLDTNLFDKFYGKNGVKDVDSGLILKDSDETSKSYLEKRGNYIPVRPKVIKLLLLIDLLSYMKFTKLWLLIRKTTN